MVAESKTLYDKLWESHKVTSLSDSHDLLYIDKHLVHEVTSPQAFDGLSLAKRSLWNRNSILAVPDHNVPTKDRDKKNPDWVSEQQLTALHTNAVAHSLRYIPLQDIRQGIVHVTGPEQGFVQPGITIVCGDSHTATHGAMAALGFGIGTSQVEQVFATQCLVMSKSKNFLIQFNNQPNRYVEAKDFILYLIGKIGTSGGTGFTLEYAGEAISRLGMEERMTICNMSIEAGARAGLIGVDQTTITYLQDKPLCPKGERFELAVSHWKKYFSDSEAVFDKTIAIDTATITPQTTWGTSPEMVIGVNEYIPDPSLDKSKEQSYQSALSYMGLTPGMKMSEVTFDKVFIGSCTNSRISDLRRASEFLRATKKKVHARIKQALVVPGSMLVKQQAEQEGIAKIFVDAGFEWRDAGCSMCLGMNADVLQSGERCASTSNRNFEGRQGRGGRTHLMSPVMAVACAVQGVVTHPEELVS
ncbi:MAG: 3-isopropylmalate dehydratase large subunit [Methylacidiphilales bacterium]|nr:3-isopropylmalate dehydratase large subunit [Candidatus Methylacidiphilales bacterium]